MKKVSWLFLVLGIVVLSVSACSFKKDEVKQVETKKEEVKLEENIKDKKIISRNEVIASESMKLCNGKALSFKYPTAWGNCQEYPNGFMFRTDFSDYQVDLVLFLGTTTKEKFNEIKGTNINLLELTRSYGEVYDYPQGGALMAGNINSSEKYYNFVFNVKSDQSAPNDLDGIWTPNHNIKNETLLEIIRSIKPIVNTISAKEKCGNEPVLISKLKVGDFYNTHKIKEISGNFLENNCEVSCPDGDNSRDSSYGKISFDGEETVSGYLFRNDGGYGGPVYFTADDIKWIPRFSFKPGTVDDNPILEGLSCENILLLSMDLNVNGEEINVPVLSKLPGIKEFLSNSKDGDKYPKKVLITVKDLETGFSFGGESGTSAKLIDVKIAN